MNTQAPQTDQTDQSAGTVQPQVQLSSTDSPPDTAVPVPEKPVDDNPIVFYCKDCAAIVETRRVGGKYVYTCKTCGTKNVAFGTKKSIYGFFRLVDKEKAKLREANREEKRRMQMEKSSKAAPPRAA